MKQIARCEFGGGLSEISLNKLIIKLIKKNIRIPAGSREKISDNHTIVGDFFVYKPLRNRVPLSKWGAFFATESGFCPPICPPF